MCKGDRVEHSAMPSIGELKEEREKARALRDEVAILKYKVRMLASINEVLLAENNNLRAHVRDSKIVDLVSRRGRGARDR